MFSILENTNYIVIGLLALTAVLFVWWIFRKEDIIYDNYNQPLESDDETPEIIDDSLESRLEKVYINSGFSKDQLVNYLNYNISIDEYTSLEGSYLASDKADILIAKWNKDKRNTTPSQAMQTGIFTSTFTDPYSASILAEMLSHQSTDEKYTGQGNGGEFAGGGASGDWNTSDPEAKLMQDLEKLDDAFSKYADGLAVIDQDEANNIGIHDTFRQLEAIQGDTPVLFGGIGDNSYHGIGLDKAYTEPDHSHDWNFDSGSTYDSSSDNDSGSNSNSSSSSDSGSSSDD